MKPLISTMFFCSIMSLGFGQAFTPSSIYNRDGRLKADTSLSISQKQCEVWRKYENVIIEQIFRVIEFPISMQENGISLDLIMSFLIGENGEIKNLNVEKAGGNPIHHRVQIKHFGASASAAIFEIYMAYPDLKCSEKYYLPISFKTSEMTDQAFLDEKYVENGTLVFLKGFPPLIDGGYRNRNKRWW